MTNYRKKSSTHVLEDCKDLDELWRYVYELNKTHFPENDLHPIFGGGKTHKPNVMFVFINPTAVNTSSEKKWKGPRFPFIGTKAVWRVFHKAGLFDQRLMHVINSGDGWSVKFTEDVLRFLKGKKFYLTNIVKWTGADSTLPDSGKAKLFLPALRKEIELVKPKHIVTFGLIPFERLTDRKVKLSDYHAAVTDRKRLEFFDIGINSTRAKVIPCYFPVGRGDPKKAADILKFVAKL